ncbi:MAG: DUF1045 domain-containing protein, partial [Pseudomonadales bacterium]|nr:DUF1045 domain-containing protein [Pseudomonadales bacterium]
ALTRRPRRYGFHATLKAPFEPAGPDVEAALLDSVEAFARRRSPFEVRFEVAPLGDFMALRLAETSTAMKELHWDCVRALDAHRAPISDADVARRRKGRLTPEQDAFLLQWGYPYIFDQFRFHMTLTSRIACRSSQEPIRAALAELFAPHTETPHLVEGIALFGQVDRQAPFRVVEWFRFRGERHHDDARVPEAVAPIRS